MASDHKDDLLDQSSEKRYPTPITTSEQSLASRATRVEEGGKVSEAPTALKTPPREHERALKTSGSSKPEASDETGEKKSSRHSQTHGQPAAVGHEGGALPPTTPNKRPESGLALWAEHARSLARSGGRSKPKPITARKTLDADTSGSPATHGNLGSDVDTPARSHTQD